MQTTLNRIHDNTLRNRDWQKLLAALGKTQADDAPLHLRTILDIIGLDGTSWCLNAVVGEPRVIRLYTVWCARQVQHLMRDPRSIAALDVAERFANGKASEEELETAAARANYAYFAATAATYATYDAADYATYAAYAAYFAANARAANARAANARAANARAQSCVAQEAELRRVLDCMDAGQDPYPR
jgi:hypothetical protein